MAGATAPAFIALYAGWQKPAVFHDDCVPFSDCMRSQAGSFFENKLLIYKSFLRLRDLGIDFVEMGGAYPYLPLNDKLRGISDFKKCFGCDLYPMFLGEMSFHSD